MQVNQPGYDGVIAINGGSGSYTNLQISGLPTGLTPTLAGNFINITGTPQHRRHVQRRSGRR